MPTLMSLPLHILTRRSTLHCGGKHVHFNFRKFEIFSQSHPLSLLGGKQIMKKSTLDPCLTRYLSSKSGNIPNANFPKGSKKRKMFWILACVSGIVGAYYFLKPIATTEIEILRYRSKGMDIVESPYYKRMPTILRYKGFNLYQFIADNMHNIHSFEVRKDDIFIVTFPKSGTTWLQEIIYLLQTDLDLESAKRRNIDERFPYLEFYFPGAEAIAKMPSPRLIKSHLPFSLLPDQIHEKKPKTIYLARNPKDVMVSYYHFSHQFLSETTFERQLFTGTFDDYCQLFIDGLGMYGPWWNHVREGWEKRNEDNVLFLTYEDMQSDIRGSIKKVAAFMGKKISDSDIEIIVNHCCFDSMKKNKTLNYSWFQKLNLSSEEGSFIRKGKVGDWKNHLSPEIVAKTDEMVKTKLKPAGLEFKYSLDD